MEPAELVGKSTRSFYRSNAEYEKIADILYAALEQNATFSAEFPCCRKDGVDIDCFVNASRIGESLKEKGIVITYEDITDRKRAEQELERSHEQLRQPPI